MDLQMPEMGGVEATACIRKLLPSTTIIGLTAVDEETARLQMLQAGATEYVIKSAAADDLVHTIRMASARDAHRHSLLQLANSRFQAEVDTAIATSIDDEITATEDDEEGSRGADTTRARGDADSHAGIQQ